MRRSCRVLFAQLPLRVNWAARGFELLSGVAQPELHAVEHRLQPQRRRGLFQNRGQSGDPTSCLGRFPLLLRHAGQDARRDRWKRGRRGRGFCRLERGRQSSPDRVGPHEDAVPAGRAGRRERCHGPASRYDFIMRRSELSVALGREAIAFASPAQRAVGSATGPRPVTGRNGRCRSGRREGAGRTPVPRPPVAH